MSYIFLDESGQFTKGDNNAYFVLASFMVPNPRESRKGYISWQRLKFPKVLRKLPEVKFSDPKLTDSFRLKTLNAIAGLEIQIRYIFLKKRNIPTEYRHKGYLKDGQLYAHIVSELLEMYLPIDDLELRIFCDERHLKGITHKNFQDLLLSYLVPKMLPGTLIQVDMISSQENPNIQIADWIAGALASYHNDRPLGRKCFDALRKIILVHGKEVFKKSWNY